MQITDFFFIFFFNVFTLLCNGISMSAWSTVARWLYEPSIHARRHPGYYLDLGFFSSCW